MENKRIEDADFSQTGYSYTLSLIAGKYKPVILYCLMEYEPVRFNQMQRYLGKIADKTLSATLRNWSGTALSTRDVPGDTAEGGIHADRARAFADARTRPALYVGDRKPGREAAPPKLSVPPARFSARGGTVIYMGKKGGPSMVLSTTRLWTAG